MFSDIWQSIKNSALAWCVAKSDEIGQDSFVRCLILISGFLGFHIILGALAYIADDPSTIWVVQCWFIYLAHGLARKTTDSKSEKVAPLYKKFSGINCNFSQVKLPIGMTNSWKQNLRRRHGKWSPFSQQS